MRRIFKVIKFELVNFITLKHNFREGKYGENKVAE